MTLFSLAGKKEWESNDAALKTGNTFNSPLCSSRLVFFLLRARAHRPQRETGVTEPVSRFVCSTGSLLCVIWIYYLPCVTSKWSWPMQVPRQKGGPPHRTQPLRGSSTWALRDRSSKFSREPSGLLWFSHKYSISSQVFSRSLHTLLKFPHSSLDRRGLRAHQQTGEQVGGTAPGKRVGPCPARALCPITTGTRHLWHWLWLPCELFSKG